MSYDEIKTQLLAFYDIIGSGTYSKAWRSARPRIEEGLSQRAESDLREFALYLSEANRHNRSGSNDPEAQIFLTLRELASKVKGAEKSN